MFILPVYGHTDVVVYNGNPVEIFWSEYGNYQYQVEVYQLIGEDEVNVFTSDWITDNHIELDIDMESSYRWDVYIKEVGKECGDQFQCFHIESGYFDFYQLPDEEIPAVEDDHITEDVEDTPVEEVLGVTTEYIPKEEYKPKKEDKEPLVEKSIGVNVCNFNYNIEKESFEYVDCNIALPTVSSSTYYKYNDMYISNVKGSYQESVTVNIQNIVCSKFDILHPNTWFGCDMNVVSTDSYDVKLDHEVYFFNKGKIFSPKGYIFQPNYFEISLILDEFPSDIVYKGYFSVMHRGEWLDKEVVFKEGVNFDEINYERDSKAIYSFPFNKLVDVNQWHGCTVYQCPHCGIDFASVKDNIYASGNGVVVSSKSSTPYSECGDSGKSIVVKLDTGQYMSYMHLDSIKVREGEEFVRGDLLGVSGNTGMYNCQALGYHLHFELRDSRWQSSHVDPVPYIDVDWGLIRTNKASVFPGRLSGDNPHPNY